MNAGGDAELIWHYDLEDEYMLVLGEYLIPCNIDF